jgi:hypothetical protein
LRTSPGGPLQGSPFLSASGRGKIKEEKIMKKLMAFGIIVVVVVAFWAVTLPGALTRASLPGRMRIERVGGLGALAETLNPPAAYKIHYIMVHYAAAVSTNDLTITLDSATSSTTTAHDYLLHTTDLSSTTDIIWQPVHPYIFLGTDDIDVAADDQSTTWGLTFCWEELD